MADEKSRSRGEPAPVVASPFARAGAGFNGVYAWLARYLVGGVEAVADRRAEARAASARLRAARSLQQRLARSPGARTRV